MAVLLLCGGWFAVAPRAWANLPGGGTNGPNVTLTDNSSTVTIANGIVSIVVTKSSGVIGTINYTFNNTGSPQTLDVLAGGHNGGQLYWENNNNQGLTFSYAVVANPANTGGNYAEVALTTTTVSNVVLEVHYSLLRGNSGFYVTAIWAHRSTDNAFSFGECRDNIYAGSIFNWMSVDATRNRLMEVQPGSAAVGVFGAPVEVSLWTNGIYAGQYEDKYKYSATFGNQRVWGWSSVGAGGKNIGLWNVSASAEYYNGGPLKRELMEHIGTTILNMLNGGHYGQGGDGSFASGEVWTKVCGPYFIYCNNVNSALTDTNAAAQALYADARAQADAEANAWPYAWFTNANYAPASQRGAVTGQIVIHDPFNPNASASNLWVGLVRQPATITGSYDFQQWMKPYQFWVRSDAAGRFTIPNVIATNNYTLYAFGPGAPGVFMSQNQTGGNPPVLRDVPASPFSVTVAAGATNDLGAVTWTPARVGPTVFEIGYPNRLSDKFRHGDDWWVGDIGPSPSNPSPIWSKWLEYPFDFPNGVNYVVGQSRWTTDWNFVQPVVTSSTGSYNNSSSTITFNLAVAPTNGATASLYLGLSSDYYAAIIVTVNGQNLGGVSGVTGSPNGSIPTTGYYAGYGGSDTTIREGIGAMASDERLTFPASLLHAGANTISIGIRQIGGSYFADHAMYDYIRLELTGYVPPPPASVAAYAGNNCNLICWPVQSGATSYNILRSTTSGGGYVSITNGVVGPVCGSGWNNATFLDTTAVNGTTYYYVVQSVNPTGQSANSPQASATPNANIATGVPSAPGGLNVSGVGHQSVTLNWNASAGADFYTIYRLTLADNGGGASNVLGTIVLANNVTNTTYVDTSPTDGSLYSYFVTATGPGGASGSAASVVAVPSPSPPANAPGSLTASGAATNRVTLSWSSVPGAVGYVIRRATSPGGPFTFVMSVTETTYTDSGLNPGTTYYYQVLAVNAGGVSPNATLATITASAAPAALSAVAGDAQITLNWTAVSGASGYYVYRGTSSGNETTVVAANYSGTSYTNTGLVNGTTYYYVVAATNAAGLGPNSPEASATPIAAVVAGGRNLIWKGDGATNVWEVNGAANWLTNGVATVFRTGDSVTFDDTGSNNPPVALIGSLLPSFVTVNASKNYTFGGSGSISGTNALVKTGIGTLTITATNFYSGGTILSNGVIALSGPAPGGVTANNFALGAGAINFAGGALQLYGYGLGDNVNGYGALTNSIFVDAGQSGIILSGPRYTFGSKVTGGGTLTLNVDYVRDDIAGDWSGFAGTLIVHGTVAGGTSSSADDFRVATAAGFPNARVFLDGTGGTNLFMYSRAAAGSVIPLGEFSATTNVTVSAGFGTSLGTQNAVTWRVGGLNTDGTNAAVFSGTVAFIKEGTGAWTLTGASTNTGAMTVNNGAFVVNGSLNGAPVTVNGGKLAGVGSIAGAAVVVNAGGVFAPGNPATGLGALTISNDLTLAGGSVTFMQIQHSPLANSAAAITGAFTANGTLDVADLGAGALTNGDSFKLFSAGTYSGAFTNVVLPPLAANLYWNTNALTTAGIIAVAALTPPAITAAAVSNGVFVISGSGAVANRPFVVLAADDLTLPSGQWTPVATNQFDASGNFSLTLTNAPAPRQPWMFYKLQVQ